VIRRFLRDSAIYGLSAIIGRGLNLLFVPFYTRVLTPSDYGVFDIATVFLSFVSLTVALEISQALARFLPDAEREEERIGIASTAFLFTLASYAGFAVLAFLIAEPLEQLLFADAAPAGFMTVVIVAAVANGIFYLVLNQLRWQLLPIQYAIANLVFAVVSIALTVLLVLAMRMGVSGVVIGQVGGSLAGLAVAWRDASPLYRLRLDTALLRSMLAFSLPLVPSSVGVFVTLYIDRIAIRSLMTFTDVGLFGIGFRVATIVSLLTVGFQTAVTPLIYSRYREPLFPGELARMFRTYVALGILMATALAVFAREILTVITMPDYVPGAVVVPFLSAAIFLSTLYVFAPGLAIAKRTGVTSVLSIGGAVANTILNFALIPVLGIVGAALATLIANAGVFVGYMVTSQRLYTVPHRWDRIALAIVIATAGYLASTQFAEISVTSLLAKAGIIVVVAGGMLAIGLVRRDEVVRLLSQTLAWLGRGKR
jgi:O-antigen/teichoic acid export membrane protein